MVLPDSFEAGEKPFRPPEPALDVLEGCSGVDPSSSYGTFVRRMCVGFDRMPFEVACKLYGACQAYLQAYEDEVKAEEGRRKSEGELSASRGERSNSNITL